MELLVKTKSGMVQGFEENGLIKYLGIPYAEKPEGDLRFRRARQVKPWDGIYQADHYGEPSVQFNEGQLMGAEDCLHLNIVRKAEGKKLPVFVYIHGGGYMTGYAGDPLYSGECFAKEGILYVSIQYRLNVLGFFEFQTYPGCEDFETNRGISDMVMALQWIHDNIAAFGGDPDNVTIGGESAGGAACVTLMAVPSVKGYFRRVIAQSALCNCVMTQKQARENMDLYIEGMGWTEADLQKLRNIPAYELLRGLDPMSAEHQYKNPGIFLPGPVIDDLLPVRPIDAIRSGSAEGISLIIGTNLHEGTMFVHPEKTGFPNSWEMVQEMFEKHHYENYFEPIREYYSQSEFDRDYGETFVHFATDYAFQMPSIKTALAQAEHGSSYLYRFEYLPESAKKNGMLVSHAFDLPCIFGVKDHPFSQLFFEGETQESADRIIEDMQRPWVRFIKTGEPDPENWPCISDSNGPARIFDRKTRTETLSTGEMMRLWGDLRFYEGE